MDFSANIKIFPGPNRSLPTAVPVKAGKKPTAFIFDLGHLSGLGSGDMRLKNELLTVIFDYLNWTLVPILKFSQVQIGPGPQLDQSKLKKNQWPSYLT